MVADENLDELRCVEGGSGKKGGIGGEGAEEMVPEHWASSTFLMALMATPLPRSASFGHVVAAVSGMVDPTDGGSEARYSSSCSAPMLTSLLRLWFGNVSLPPP